MKKFLIFSLMLLLFLSVVKVSATTDEIGSTGGNSSLAQAGYSWAFDITATSSGYLYSIGINIIHNNGMIFRLAIYNDSGDAPYGLLYQSNDIAVIDGWNYASTFPILISNGTKYWLSYQAEYDYGNDTIYQVSGSGVNRHADVHPFGLFSDPFNSIYSDNFIVNMRMVYSPSVTTTVTTTAVTTSVPVEIEIAPTQFRCLDNQTIQGNVTINGVPQVTAEACSWGCDMQLNVCKDAPYKAVLWVSGGIFVLFIVLAVLLWLGGYI